MVRGDNAREGGGGGDEEGFKGEGEGAEGRISTLGEVDAGETEGKAA